MKFFLLVIIFGFLSFATARDYCNLGNLKDKYLHSAVIDNIKFYGNNSKKFVCAESVKIIDLSTIGIIPSRIEEVTCEGCLELKKPYEYMVDDLKVLSDLIKSAKATEKFPTAKEEVYLKKHVRYECYSSCVMNVGNGCKISK